MEKRYSRALGALTEGEIAKLRSARAAVVGCGGIGGYVIEELCRLGVGEIVAIDPDRFEETNLNRQLLATKDSIGQNKAHIAAQRAAQVNPEVKLFPITAAFSRENGRELLSGCGVVIDALDSAAARRELAEVCAQQGLYLVHGAISGWQAQVSVLPPGSDAFSFMYPEGYDDAKAAPSLAFTPALAASIEVSQAIKLLLGRQASLSGKLLHIDLQSMEFNTVAL